MDPSSAQHQDMGINASQENLLISPKSATTQPERKPRPTPEAVLRCPRCDSTNTKFCYYNNYSLSQPRYFCKSCRRYWTKGGTLRNVPVGGGCRKNKRPSSSSSSKRSQDHHPLGMMHTPTNPNPHNPLSSLSSLASYDSPNFDLSLAFARLHNNKQLLPEFDHLSIFGNPSSGNLSTPSHDVLGNPIHGGYFENNNIQGSGGFHCNMYSYGLGNGEIESAGISEEMGGFPNYDQEMSCGATTTPTTSTAVTVTPMKQVLCNGEEGDHHNRALWGFPWQNIVGSNTGDGNDMGDVELPGRESWNGITTSWHGLLNSPLM